MAIKALEIDPTHFEIVATSETAIMTKHRESNTLGVWCLEWRDRGNFPIGFEGEAWAAYMRASQ